MLIFLDDSLMTHCFEEMGIENIKWNLECIAHAAISGSHIVFGSAEALKWASEIISTNTKCSKLFKKILENSPQIGGLVQKLKVIVMIIPDGKITSTYDRDNKNIIRIPIAWFSTTEKLRKVKLVCEDIRDCKFYKLIGDWYFKYILGSRLEVNIEKINGGGANTGMTLSESIEELDTFHLCVVDSDKKYPTDDIGQVAKDVINVKNGHDLTDVIVLKFRTYENLIPLEIFNAVATSGNNEKDTVSQLNDLYRKNKLIINFIAFKKGITVEKDIVKNNNIEIKKYWKDVYLDNDELKKITCNNTCYINDKCSDECKVECYIIKKLGRVFFRKCNEKIKDIINNNQPILLDDIIKEKWMRIGAIVASWGCTDRMRLNF